MCAIYAGPYLGLSLFTAINRTVYNYNSLIPRLSAHTQEPGGCNYN